tara:strand:- start:5778 stop:6170 length:393 start_codon:yes stop_codon:yes gene_type:complete
MPFFKTTVNIVKDNDEYFDPNWMDSDTLKLPPNQKWSYDRELQIEDIDIWEVLHEVGSLGLYAAWHPYAEFYLFKPPFDMVEKGWGMETYYGPMAAERAAARLKDFGITLPRHQVWVEPDELWLHMPKNT